MKDIRLSLPIKIPYAVMQQLLETKLIGMEIGKSKRRGQILCLSLKASPMAKYDILFGLRIGLMPMVFWSKEVPLYIHASLSFNPVSGRLSVGTFKIDAESKNFVVDKALEFLANRIYYRKILDKATINTNELIAAKIDALNEKLRSGISSSQGLLFGGSIQKITITKIEAGLEYMVVNAQFEGEAEVTLQYIPDSTGQ